MNHGTVLLIAFHFPPFRGSSGMQRTLRFAEHLPKFGWTPIVLTASPRAYDATSQSKGNEIPAGLEVHRAFGLDTARHLSLFGRYPAALALPDRWATWQFAAIPAALRIIRERRVDVVLSTFPIATAHAIGLEVACRTGLPWIAEFRDPMWQGDYPPDPRTNAAWKALEARTFAAARRVVVTSPSAASEYAARFPQFERSNIALIENGYDEETFRRAGCNPGGGVPKAPAANRPVTLLHSGIVYPSERDPSQLFAALASLKRQGRVNASVLRLVLRASGNEAAFRRELATHDIADLVALEPPIDYLEALREMLAAEGLLVLQASNCNAQVPAKIYEYLRANRPILALTDPAGDTARTLQSAGVGLVARLDSAEEIGQALLRFVTQISDGSWPRASAATIAGYSREAQAGRLARLLDEVAGP